MARFALARSGRCPTSGRLLVVPEPTPAKQSDEVLRTLQDVPLGELADLGPFACAKGGHDLAVIVSSRLDVSLDRRVEAVREMLDDRAEHQREAGGVCCTVDQSVEGVSQVADPLVVVSLHGSLVI